jgi:DNA-directed RNA polymerase specialized sigma24 family protein
MRQSDQTMIDMFYREERSYMEIAVQLELPIGTVKSRLNRARHRLKQLMAESAPGA